MSAFPPTANRFLKLGTCVVLWLPFTLPCSLLAQGASVSESQSSQASQVKILTDRVAALEQRLIQLAQKVATDETRVGTPPVGNDPPSASSPPGGLSKADEARLDSMQKEISQLENQQNSETKAVNHPKGPNRPPSPAATTVVAPFRVLDDSGSVIMSVEENKKGVMGGLKVFASDGGFVQVGAGTKGTPAVRIFSEPSGANPRVFVGIGRNTGPQIAIQQEDGKTNAQLLITDNKAELDLFNSDHLAAMIGSDIGTGQGHAVFYSAEGGEMIRVNQKSGHGDVDLIGDEAFSAWDMMVLGLIPLRGAAAPH